MEINEEGPARFAELFRQLLPEQKERAKGYIQHCLDREAMGRPSPLSALIYLDPEAAIKIAAGIED